MRGRSVNDIDNPLLELFQHYIKHVPKATWDEIIHVSVTAHVQNY